MPNKKTTKNVESTVLDDVDEFGRVKDLANAPYKYSDAEQKLLEVRKKRFQVMWNFKKKLGIDEKCDRMDALFTPHLTGVNNSGAQPDDLDSAINFDNHNSFEERRKSIPLAFEKITTAVALMIKENPRIIPKPFREKYRKLNLMIENIYYENYKINRKKEVYAKYVYQKAKYGIAYWREFIKKTYCKKHVEQRDENGDIVRDEQGNVVYDTFWGYDVNEQVAANIHPKNIVLDNTCLGPNDVNKPAKDLFIYEDISFEEFKDTYPVEVFPNAEFVNPGTGFMFTKDKTEEVVEGSDDSKDIVQVIIYENKPEGLRETWINSVPIESIPLPGGVLSVSGGKWVDDVENYDGIGVGQILEIYQPIVDDIRNASLERIRQIVRPVEDWFNDIELTDESSDVNYGSGNVRKFNGSPDDVRYSNPPPPTAGEQNEQEGLYEEIDRATMIPRNLAGTDDANTAFQAAQNRESALRKLSIPLGSIKNTIEQAGNIALALWPMAYGEPEETKVLKEGDDDFDEACKIVEVNPKDERVIKNEDGTITRRYFKQMELPVEPEIDKKDGKNVPTGRFIETEEKQFWETIPRTFNWVGRIEVIAESILPTSKALEDEQKKETFDWLMQIPVINEMGQPVFVDDKGKPYIIDKIKAAKERVRIIRDLDPDKYIVPMENTQSLAGGSPLDQGGGDNPLASKGRMSPLEAVGAKRPETSNLTSIK